MSEAFKLSSNMTPFGSLRDRFINGYKEGHPLQEQLELMKSVGGIDGVALAWPAQFQDGAQLRKQLDEAGLQLATVDTDIYTEPRFKLGSFSNPDPAIRRAAIDRAKGTIDAALAAGSPDVNLWPGHDGFDYLFQGHYADAWKWIEEGLQEVAEHDPEMPVSLEYKGKEPRANEYFANMGKALWLVNKINKPHVGITLDVGHSQYVLENPAECAVLALREGKLQQIHVNDNFRDWDHDLVPGSVNPWDFVEFLFWVRKFGYNGWYNVDIFPYREDGIKVMRSAVKACHACWELAGRLLDDNTEELLRGGEHLAVKDKLWEYMGF